MRKSSTKRWRPLLRHRLSHLTHLRLLLRSPLATSTKPSTLAPEELGQDISPEDVAEIQHLGRQPRAASHPSPIHAGQIYNGRGQEDASNFLHLLKGWRSCIFLIMSRQTSALRSREQEER